jgi:hypothetical protein
MAPRRTKKLSKLDKYLIFCIAVLIAYTIAEIITATMTGIEHSTLTTCLFSAFGGEFLMAALIKIFNIKSGKDNENG